MVIRSKQKLKISKPFNVVLLEPEIPPNTGNIARLCAATNTRLHLIHPLGFEVNDKHLKRAGLDYWSLLEVKEHESWDDFTKDELSLDSRVWLMSTRGEKNIWDIEYSPGDYIVFGSETRGIDENILNRNLDSVISIPMNGMTRSINLATAVGITLYEGLRQVTKVKNEYQIVDIAK